MNNLYQFLKRGLDIFSAGFGLILLMPIWVILILLVKLDSDGPVFYSAARVGKGGREFGLLKFRTMIKDADKIGPQVTYGADTRITKAGRWLRRLKLDETPQLINVLKGDMSLVGPRPESPFFVKHYSRQDRNVLSVKPGMTSLAWVRLHNDFDEENTFEAENWKEHYLNVSMPRKLAVDMEYIEKRSFCGDIKIILQTVFAPFLDK